MTTRALNEEEGVLSVAPLHGSPLVPEVAFPSHTTALVQSLGPLGPATVAACRHAVLDAGLSVVIAMPGDDVHVAANQVTERVLKSLGFRVANVGVTATAEEIAEAVRWSDAAAVILSTINGHALANCAGIPDALRRSRASVPCAVGGNLGISSAQSAWVRAELESAGYARVFEAPTSIVTGLVEIAETVCSLKGIDSGRQLQWLREAAG